MAKQYFVYILTNRPRGVLYVGMTNDLLHRLEQHRSKSVPGFTLSYGAFLLAYYEQYESLIESRARERTLKRWRRAWKLELIEKMNPEWRDLAGELAL
jgi:putative endonuclease